MSEMNAVPCDAGSWAVVVPVDLEQGVRIIDLPGQDSMGALYREIGCPEVNLREVAGFGFWVDGEGAMGEGWAANGRVLWLGARMGDDDRLIVAGTVVVTLAAPDADGETQGMSIDAADEIAGLAGDVPGHDPDELTRRLREIVDRGPVVIPLDMSDAATPSSSD